MVRPALLVLLVFASGCGSGTGAGAVSDREASASHRQMVEHLARIRTETPDHNRYIGDQEVRDLQASLEILPDDAPDIERFRLLWMLGYNLVRLGKTEESIAEFKKADKILAKSKLRLLPEERDQFLLHFSTAYLRLGENQNCVMCQNEESCILPIRGGGIHTKREGSKDCIQVLNRLLEKNPKHLTARWLVNLANMTLGTHPQGVESKYRIPPEKFVSEEAFPRMVNVAGDLGINAFDLCGGSITDDFDGDGLVEIVASSWDTSVSVNFFKNQGDGTFKDLSKEAGLAGIFGGLSMNQADFDNDGDLDILVLRGAWWGENGQHPNSLLRNDGQGHFVDVTYAVGLAKVNYPTQAASWADFENDGDLDLYIGNENYPAQLFQNDGTGRFKDVAAEAGVLNEGGFAKGVVWGDYNADRRPDIYVSNYGQENRLYRNDGDGRFTDVAPELGVTHPIKSFPTWFWDVNNDGNLDLWVSSWWPDVKYLSAELFNEPFDAEYMCLYLGDGHGGFKEVAKEQGLHRYALPMGSNFGDIDNDGFPDFYLGTGYPEYEGLMPNLLFRNKQGSRFVDVTYAAGVGHLQKGHGVSFADLDNDGDQDLHVQMGGAFPGDKATNLLYENPGFKNHVLAIQLVGQKSNRFGVGARIKARIQEGPNSRAVYKWVDSGGSFGANPLRQQLGLGQASVVQVLEVYWPTSDTTQRFENVKADQLIEITEGQDRYRPLDWKPAPFKTKARQNVQNARITMLKE